MVYCPAAVKVKRVDNDSDVTSWPIHYNGFETATDWLARRPLFSIARSPSRAKRLEHEINPLLP